MDKLQEQLMAVSMKLDERNAVVTQMKELQAQQNQDYELRLSELLETVSSVSHNLEDKASS